MGLEEQIASYSKTVTLLSTIILLVISTVSLKIKHPKSVIKKLLFFIIVAITITTTLFLAASTIFLNSVSSSKGPVHHHADFEIWACGQELNLKDPKGLSNKIGTSTLHEHNDKRIHLEGVIVKPQDASLGKFFRVIEGELNQNSIVIPTNEGQITFRSGEKCPNGQTAILQVFLYKVSGKSFTQTKLKDPQNYIITPESGVPPGDCIIIEFDQFKERTDKLCQSFKVAIQTGKLKGELKY